MIDRGASFEEALDAARNGAPWAFEWIFEALAASVAGYLRSQGLADPEDLANEVFLRAFTHLPRFRGGEDRFRGWLFTIAHHCVIDERRKASRRPSIADADVPESAVPGGDAGEQAMRALAEERVRALLAGLTARQRDVMLLRILGDLSTEQVAAVLGTRVSAVKALQRRALAALRRDLERMGVSR